MAARFFSLIEWTLLGGALAPGRGGRQSTGRLPRCQSIVPQLIVAFTLGLSAHAAPTAPALSDDDLAAAIRVGRAVKDSLFRHGDDSPLRPADVPEFAGLRYFPVNLSWRIEGELHRYGRTRQIPLPDTGGSTIAVERFGRFVFQLDGKPFWLEVYRSLQGGDLTVYFTDQTNGITTYGAGRYVAVSRPDDDMHIIDFNGAYSPYCAYNEDYVCPLPPAQNHLAFEVNAGELEIGPDLAH